MLVYCHGYIVGQVVAILGENCMVAIAIDRSVVAVHESVLKQFEKPLEKLGA